jgi:hypothetical protein
LYEVRAAVRALVSNQPLCCPQTDTSDPEKVVSAFLKVASVFRDDASVKTAVLDAIGKGRGGAGTPRCSPEFCTGKHPKA